MNIRSSVLCAGLLVGAPGFCQTPVVAYGTSVVQTASIKLGPILIGLPIIPLPPRSPYTIAPGSHLQIVAYDFGYANPVATWYKNGKVLPGNSLTLDIPSASSADTGSYSAMVSPGGDAGSGNASSATDSAMVVVALPGQRLINFSSLARIDPTHPSLLNSFVVDPGPAGTWLVIRAVGPALATFGVTDPLAAPQLRVVDSTGRLFLPWQPGVIMFPVSGLASHAQAPGAFPLPDGSNDVSELFYLPAGAYTAELTSADGSSGTALLEIYQLGQ
ncbi:MAG TPA: immunoglobulin domain-containing protein [Opitutaceae bacterium]|nr:immunoglobulin domain-containing protein [Opitutaceae bacterium]